MNLSNYSIKRMIPRLIIAAILVNASFYITALAVDLSNLLGYNIMKLFGAIDIGATGVDGFQSGWQEIIGVVLLGVASVGLIVAILLAPTVLLAFGLIIMILIARKALVVILIVLAPVAFVAYLLPNTEDWFKKWYKAFVALLMVFPIISLVFGGSLLASNVLLLVAKEENAGDTQNMLYIVALATAAIPLFAVPTLLKSSLAAAGSVGQKLAGLQDRTNRYAGKKAMEGRIGEAKTAFQARRQERKVARRRGDGRIAKWGKARPDTRRGRAAAWVGTRSAAFDRTRSGKYFGGDRGAAAATAQYHKAIDEEVDRQETLLSETPADKLLDDLNENGARYGAEKKAAILRRIAKAGGDQHVQAAIDYLDRNKGQEGLADAQQLASKELLARKEGLSGLSTSQANALKDGSFGGGGGYKEGFKDRIRSRAFSEQDFSRMGKDDLIQLAEMSRDNDLDDDDIAYIKQMRDNIAKHPTMKGSLSGERLEFFDAIEQRRTARDVKDNSEKKLYSYTPKKP